MTEQPCPWTINTNCCPDWDSYSPELQADATAWATHILWALTGRRFGLCEVAVRPCGGGCSVHGGYMTYPVTLDGGSASGGWWMYPYTDASGAWRNCACSGSCRCHADCEVPLPGPVDSIVSVVVNGVTLDPSAYRVDNRHFLIRQDGECFPDCQDFNAPDDSPDNTFVVTYLRGEEVPPAGQIAAGLLACDFAKSCTTGCALPGNLASLSRQGVDVTLADPVDELNDGLTGVPQVDQWIRAVNPYRATRRPRVYSLDTDYPRMTTA
jgi:hypothetical protein